MLYIKTSTPDGKEVHTPLDEVALFNKCPVCGAECKTGFYEFLDGFENFGTEVDVSFWCDACTARMRGERDV